MANEKRLIDANELVSLMEYYDEQQQTDIWETNEIEHLLGEISTVDAVEVVHGRWEAMPDNQMFLRCSVCHGSHIYAEWDYDSGPMWYYCPNCGAKMDLKGDNK